MSLYDIIACPVCKGELRREGGELHCTACRRGYPIMSGVPILLPDPSAVHVQHEAELILRSEYDPWIPRMVMQSFTDGQVVVDAGCGNVSLDDPCIIRMDVTLTPYVDIVADLHALPFKPETIDLIFSLAVVEHLRQPFLAAEEMFNALKPGGYVYGECNFVYAYHGYPHHYFNASIHGMKQVFAHFREIRLDVAPYQMPSFTLQNVINSYLGYFQAETPSQMRFASVLRKALEYPLHHYDSKLAPNTAFKLAAGEYFFGQARRKQSDTVIPEAVMAVYRASAELQRRFPDPDNLGVPDNLMYWALQEGRRLHPSIDQALASVKPFTKYSDGRSYRRVKVREWTAITHPDEQRIQEPNYPHVEQLADQSVMQLAYSIGTPSLFDKALFVLRHYGWRTLVQKTVHYFRRKLHARAQE